MGCLLEVNNIEVIYSEVILVLKGMSLKVEEGQIAAILGNNGAGKSTYTKGCFRSPKVRKRRSDRRDHCFHG